MFGYTTRQFIINWLGLLLASVVGMAFALGSNSLTGDRNLITGFGLIGDLFGGWAAVGGPLLILLIVIVAFFGQRHIAKSDYKQKANIIGLGSVVVLAAVAFIGVNWIVINEQTLPALGGLLLLVVIVTVLAALITPRTKKVVAVAPAAATPHPVAPATTATPAAPSA